MTTAPACNTCKHCAGDVMTANSAKCSAVTDPITGAPMLLPQARQNTYGGYDLPCGYAGLLWVGKPS